LRIRKNGKIHNVCWSGRTKCVEVLLNAGADLHAKNDKNKTPLDLAKHENHTECILLLENDAA